MTGRTPPIYRTPTGQMLCAGCQQKAISMDDDYHDECASRVAPNWSQSCIHPECDRSPDPEVAGRACCMACAMTWGARIAPVHIGRCDRRAMAAPARKDQP